MSTQVSDLTRSTEEEEKLTNLLREHNLEIQSESDRLKNQILEMESMLRSALAAKLSLEQDVTVLKGQIV